MLTVGSILGARVVVGRVVRGLKGRGSVALFGGWRWRGGVCLGWTLKALLLVVISVRNVGLFLDGIESCYFAPTLSDMRLSVMALVTGHGCYCLD